MLQKRQTYTAWTSSTITLSGKSDVASNMIVQVRQQSMVRMTLWY